MFQPFSRLPWRDSGAITKNADLLRFCTPEAPQHIVQFYSDDSVVTGNIAFLLRHALEAGESSVIIATQSHLDGIDRKLEDAGFDLDVFRKARCYFPVNATELLPRLIFNGLPDQDAFETIIGSLLSQAAQTSKNGFVFAFGELVAELCASKNPVGAVRMEQLWNELARRNQFSLYCAYPLAVVTSDPTLDAIFDICEQHSITIPAETSL